MSDKFPIFNKVIFVWAPIDMSDEDAKTWVDKNGEKLREALKETAENFTNSKMTVEISE